MNRRDSRDRDGNSFGRNDGPRGPPPEQNSRFAAAAAADRDYQERNMEDRDRFDDRRGGDRFDDRRGGDRFDDRRGGDRFDDGRGGDRYDDRRGGYDDRRGGYDDRRGPGGGYGRNDDAPPQNSAADILKPKARPMEDSILKVPTKAHQENVLVPPTKEHADNVLKIPTKTRKEEEPPKSKPVAAAPAPAVDVAKAVDDTQVIADFISGDKLGEDLKSWVSSQVVPSVEKLVFTLLTEKEKLNPDIECGWADASKYGAALVSLVEDDLLKQVDVLFGIQKYCDKLGFPKLNGEYVVQAMFRAMYKFDLAEDEAFAMWKEDDSSEHEAGKVNTVIQTVDWFNWLEEDDEEEEEDYEEE